MFTEKFLKSIENFDKEQIRTSLMKLDKQQLGEILNKVVDESVRLLKKQHFSPYDMKKMEVLGFVSKVIKKKVKTTN